MPLFGRKKNVDDAASRRRAEREKAKSTPVDEDEELLDDEDLEDLDEDGIDDDAELSDDADLHEDDDEDYEDEDEGDDLEDDESDEEDDDDLDDDDSDDEDEDEGDEWDQLDAAQDWRDDGPFDIEEVDLEDDEVSRLDLGSMILTPFENLQLQLQMDEATGRIQAALAMFENSGLEVALFGAPRSGGMAKEVRNEIVAAAREVGGTAELAKGPFGTEVKRVLPVQAPDGSDAIHVSRVWLVEGPRWVLRGTLMGEAAMTEDESKAHELTEFFKNLVIRRGEEAVAAGDLIPMTLPDEMKPEG